MAKQPRDFDAELHALAERTKKLKAQKTAQLGELVHLTGADALPVDALAGALLAAVERAKEQPEAAARWAERGQAFFRQGSRRQRKGGNGDGPGSPAPSAAGDVNAAQAHGGPA